MKIKREKEKKEKTQIIVIQNFVESILAARSILYKYIDRQEKKKIRYE